MARNKVKDPNHLSFGRLMAWKSSDISAGWVNVIMLNYLSMYASDFLGLNIGLVGVLLFISKLLDGLVDFFIGWLVDNTHTPWGKARPYEICIVGQTLATLFLFLAKPEWAYTAKVIWVFTMYVLTFSVFGSLRAVPMSAYTIRAFSNNPVLIRKVASYAAAHGFAPARVTEQQCRAWCPPNHIATREEAFGCALAMLKAIYQNEKRTWMQDTEHEPQNGAAGW